MNIDHKQQLLCSFRFLNAIIKSVSSPVNLINRLFH